MLNADGLFFLARLVALQLLDHRLKKPIVPGWRGEPLGAHGVDALKDIVRQTKLQAIDFSGLSGRGRYGAALADERLYCAFVGADQGREFLPRFGSDGHDYAAFR